jgi:hypothetical protein
LANTRSSEHTLTLNLNHTSAAISICPVARRILPAKVWNGCAFALGNLPDGLTVFGFDFAPVQGELD